MKEQPNTLDVKTMFWCNMLKIVPALNQSNGGNSRPVSSWCNAYTGPPLVSMALDLVSTLQSTQGRTKV
jgi:hypothetical protein